MPFNKKYFSMKKIVAIIIFACAVAAGSESKAQNLGSNYKTAIGAKGYFGDGSIGGFNIKHFMRNNQALEGGLYFKRNFVMFEGMYEWSGQVQGAQGLHWYTGPGAWLGFYTKGDDNVLFALKGTIGLDYKFTGAPIDIAFDVNPTFTLAPDSDFNFYAGIAFRFAL
jgi:hypothetical protein